MGRFVLGIDIGGTFTDIVMHDREQGRRYSRKVLTTHQNPQRGVIGGIEKLLAEEAIAASQVGRVVHATTLFTNALIERRGVVTGLITTAGFRDTLEIGRERKYDLYDLGILNPPPLVARDMRLEVSERMRADGEVLTPLEVAELLDKVDMLKRAGATSIAVVFLHSYINPRHELEAVAAIAAHAPELHLTASHEVAPEIREYERASTAVASAYVKPLAIGYLASMEQQIAALGIRAPLMLMLSSGGLTNRQEVVRNPVQMLESGPAAGALSAAFFGGRDGERDLLAFDMGGTTAKLCLIEDGQPAIAYSFEAAREKRFAEGSGLPIRISTVELIEIGAGGGSIARRNEIGFLKVGPDSAGSEPGPACYGLGGDEPTVTDANLLLGYLNPDFFAGGTMSIKPEAAEAAIDRLARTIDLDVPQVAAGIHNLVNETMAGAARVHIAERGHDPRRFSLVVTGGGGPVHGYGVARKLGLSRIICPPSPGVASALGLLVAPARVDRMATVNFRVADGDVTALEAAFARLEEEARAVIAATGLPLEAVTVERLVDGRFAGQGFDLVVKLGAGPYGEASRSVLSDAFHRSYREKFTRPPPDVPLEFLNIRVSVTAAETGGRLADPPPGRGVDGARKGVRRCWFDEAGAYVETPVYDRDLLGAGDAFDGPALVEDPSSTLVVGPAGRCRMTASGNIIVEIDRTVP